MTLATRYLACWTQEEIAEAEGIDQRTADRILGEFADLQRCLKPAQTLATYAEPANNTVNRQEVIHE